MAPEILQLLLLLSLGNSGKPGRTLDSQYEEVRSTSPGSKGQEDWAEEQHGGQEGETFSVNCSYKAQEHENRWMYWCKKQENEVACNTPPSETNSTFFVSDNKYFSSYRNDNGTITITITFKLRANDSGDYQCVIPLESTRSKVLRRLRLKVWPVQEQSPTEDMQTTSEVTSSNPATNRPSISSTSPPAERSSTLSTTPLDEGSSEKKFSTLGVVLSCLLLSVLLVVGIICARKIYQKAGEGDDSETQGEKPKSSAMEMDSKEDAEGIHYATVSERSPGELISVKTHTPVEAVEYATVTKK